MRKSLFGLVLIPLALGLAAPAVFAQPGSRGDQQSETTGRFKHHRGGKHGKFRKHRGERGFAKLGLSDDQKAKLKTAREAMFTSGKALHEQMKTRQDAVKAALLKPTPNRTEILSLSAEVGKVQTQLQTLHVDFMLQAKAIMTPDQFAKFVEMGPGMGGRGGRRGHGGKDGWKGRGGKGGFGPRDGSGPGFGPPPTVDEDDAE